MEIRKNQKEIDAKAFLRKAKGMLQSQIDRQFLTSLREKLVLYMKMNPEVSRTETLKSPFLFGLGFLMAPALAILILILVVGGTALASQNSLPGDALYPVKILAEEITVATSFTPQARSQARLSNASERVREVSKLTERNESDVNANSEEFHAAMQTVITNFGKQVSASLSEGRKLSNKRDNGGALQIANDIEAATGSFKKTLDETRSKGNDKTAQDLNQFIDVNNRFNARAELQSGNAGEGKDDFSSGSDKKADGRDSGENLKKNNNGQSGNAETESKKSDNQFKQTDSSSDKQENSNNGSSGDKGNSGKDDKSKKD